MTTLIYGEIGWDGPVVLRFTLIDPNKENSRLSKTITPQTYRKAVTPPALRSV